MHAAAPAAIYGRRIQEWRTVSESAPAMTSTMLLYTLMLPFTFQKVVRPWPEWPIGLRRPWSDI
jgi:hypothetical protein